MANGQWCVYGQRVVTPPRLIQGSCRIDAKDLKRRKRFGVRYNCGRHERDCSCAADVSTRAPRRGWRDVHLDTVTHEYSKSRARLYDGKSAGKNKGKRVADVKVVAAMKRS